jgi:hypothetical protein
MTLNLQSLKIPAGWTVEWNVFTETDPTEENIHEFSGNLLLLNSSTRLKAIELCWTPEEDINGRFQLKVINLEPHFNAKTNEMEYEGLWGSPDLEYETKDRLEVVAKINELLFFLKAFKDQRILFKPGVVDVENEKIRQELLSKGLTNEISLKIIKSNHKKLQGLLLDHRNILKETVITLAEFGASKGVKNKAKQLLSSKRF